MKRSSLVDSCSYSRIFSCVFFLLSFCIFFVETTNAQVMHRRLWPWPVWPYPQPWPMNPPASPSPPLGPSPCPPPPSGPSPCPPPPPKPQPKPPPSPIPCPPTPPKPQPHSPPPPAPCPPPPPKPQPKPPPSPSPSPCPPTPPKPQPHSPPTPPNPQPKPHPAPNPGPCPSPNSGPCPSPPKPPAPAPKPVPGPPPKPTPSPPKPNDKTIPAVFFFGDSVFDTGNNDDRKTKMKSNYRPYGMDFKDGVATGRFSNGKVASDYISKYLGVKETVPAYLDPKIQPNDLLTGVSFASGGAGYHPTTSKKLKAIPMLDQLTYFQDYIDKVNELARQDKKTGEVLAGLEDTNKLIAKGLAIVVGGSSDLVYTYIKNSQNNDIDAFTTIMADSAASFVLQLYGYGARRIGVIGTPPLGCTPSQRIKKKKKCNEELNYAAQLFNSKLLIILGQLAKTLPNSTLVYMDVYTIISQMLETPGVYGFEEIKKSCCKTRVLSGGALCKKSTRKICANTSSYMFWDGMHPTQRAYKIINKALVQEYLPYFT